MKSRSFIWILIVVFTAIATSIATSVFVKTGVQIKNLEFVLNSIILCAATFTGFILTSLSILLGLSNRPVMQDLKKGTGLDELKVLYSCALTLGFILIIACIILGAILSFADEIIKGIIVVGVGLISAYLVSILITGYALVAIMNLLSKDKAIKLSDKPQSPGINL